MHIAASMSSMRPLVIITPFDGVKHEGNVPDKQAHASNDYKVAI